jgi:PAS domain S-box-containing protein
MNQQDAKTSEFTLSLNRYQIKVLLIDDQPFIGEAVRRMLASEDDIVFHYCSEPIQAIQQATEIAPTVILQDLVMPEVDGLLLLRFFRANAATRDIPMIVLSTKEEVNLKAEAFATGANDYIVKLPEPIELIARIRYHSQAYINRRQRDEAYLAMQESEQRLRTILENMPVMMTAFDIDGNIIVWNRECERVTGYPEAEIVTNPQARELVYGEKGQESRGNDFRVREWEIACKDGSIKTVVWSNINDHFSIPGWQDGERASILQNVSKLKSP